jgi:hypothetical protein
VPSAQRSAGLWQPLHKGPFVTRQREGLRAFLGVAYEEEKPDPARAGEMFVRLLVQFARAIGFL